MSESYSVMVVDDNDCTRRLLAMILAKEGLTLIEVNSGEECLKRAASDPPDLIILDVVMSDINGFEVCIRLKQNDKTCHIPVIFNTSRASREDILRGFEVGGVDYISKPVDRQIVTARVRSILAIQGLVKEKENLLRVNQLILKKLEEIIKDVQLPSKMSTIKEEVTEASNNIFSQFDSLKSSMETAMSSLCQVELSFQFTDRLNQQINEINKVVNKLHTMLDNDAPLRDPVDITNHASSPSVFVKTNQQQVDDLLNSLL